MAHTLLAFHAHPDDEALLTAGTMARAAAEGHRVLLVVATDGKEGLAASNFAAAGRLADILLEESVDVLLTYDANGGYGHRDHVKVHRVGARAAELAQTPRVLQATVPRDTIRRALAVVGKVYRFP